jgi:hypothetical protein
MDGRLKKLEIKKLLKEYNYLMTDDEFKKEMVDEYKSAFLEKVGEIRKDIPPTTPPQTPPQP